VPKNSGGSRLPRTSGSRLPQSKGFAYTSGSSANRRINFPNEPAAKIIVWIHCGDARLRAGRHLDGPIRMPTKRGRGALGLPLASNLANLRIYSVYCIKFIKFTVD
jgi:hypothetical protein